MTFALAFVLALAATGRTYVVAPAESSLEIEVAKAGAFSPFLHDHRFRPDRWSGEVKVDPASPESLEAHLVVEASSLHDHEPGISASDEAEIDRTAQGPEVLDSQRFPTIRLDARGMRDGVVEATLTLHGETRAVRIPVKTTVADGRATATGSFSFKQSEFGITPYHRALGSIAVKDEVTVRFRLVAK